MEHIQKRSQSELEVENEILRGQVAELTAKIEMLSRKITELEKKLGQNSSNSSLPPSSDLFGRKAKTNSPSRKERRAMERKPGKQPGSEGKNLAQVTNPDQVIIHVPEACDSCGADLYGAKVISEEVRQVFDVIKPKMVVTEHRVIKLRCSCGNHCESTFPIEARAQTCYGPRIRANALYLMARQHLPLERTKEAISDLLGLNCSTGFLDDVYNQGAEGLGTFIDEITSQLAEAEVVHFDETSIKVKKARHWLHVASTKELTLLHANRSRGKGATEAVGVLPSFGGVSVHDRLAMYFDYKKSTHAVCGAHLLRNLASVAVADNQREWATKMSGLLIEMAGTANEAREAGLVRIAPYQLTGYLGRYDAIVREGLNANPTPTARKRDSLERESYNLVSAFCKLRSEVTLFASDLRVPFTNNQAERDLRMAKLQQKISGSLRSAHGAERLAKVRSYISTASKHQLDTLDVLTELFLGHPWIPPMPLRT